MYSFEPAFPMVCSQKPGERGCGKEGEEFEKCLEASCAEVEKVQAAIDGTVSDAIKRTMVMVAERVRREGQEEERRQLPEEMAGGIDHLARLLHSFRTDVLEQKSDKRGGANDGDVGSGGSDGDEEAQ